MEAAAGVAAASGGPGSAEAETLAEVVEAEGIGQGGAVAAGLGGVVGLDDLIADPAGDEEAEDAVLVGEGDEDGEDDEMNDSLGVLAVVHGSDAGDEAEQGGETGVGSPGWRDSARDGIVADRQCRSRRRRRQEEVRRRWRALPRGRVRRRQRSRRRGCTPGTEVCRSSDKMQYFHDQDGLRSSYQSPFLLEDTGNKMKQKSCRWRRGDAAAWMRAELDQPDVAAGGSRGGWIRVWAWSASGLASGCLGLLIVSGC